MVYIGKTPVIGNFQQASYTMQVSGVNAETKKASGKQKLLDLGLTEAEVKALIGI